jgi:hypothetical protein
MSLMTLSAADVLTSEPGSGSEDVPLPRIRIVWVELTCLPCGEVAGYVENHRLVRPITPGGIRIERGRMRCGRCGGVLLTGDHGVASTRDSIG